MRRDPLRHGDADDQPDRQPGAAGPGTNRPPSSGPPCSVSCTPGIPEHRHDRRSVLGHEIGELQQQGFDFCYDKRLYDRIIEGDASAVRGHLRADLAYQSRLLRFLENHDEPRIASRLGPGAERAAAVAIATLPGATMWHEGQFEGRGGHRSSWPAARTSRSMLTWPTGIAACWPPWPGNRCGQASGGCWRPRAGPTTRPTATWPRGPGPGTVPVTRRLVVINLWAAGPGTGPATLAGPARPELAAHRHTRPGRVRAGRRRAG